MAGALPPVTQVFEVNAAAFMAGIDEMLAGVERLAVGIDRVAAASDRLGVAGDVAGAGEARVAAGADEAAVALDREAAAAERAGTAAEGAGEKSAAFGGALKTAGLGIAIGVGYAVDKAAKFQAEVTKLYTAAGLTGASMKTVSAEILKVGDATGYSGTQIAEALYHPVSAGLDLKTALAAVSEGAKLAQIHGASLDDTMYALSSVMKAFNQNAGDAGKTAALLNSIVGQGDMRFQDFNQSVKNWAPTAASMGISIQSMGAGLAYLTDRGNSAEVASTRLTMGLSMVTAPSKAANTYLRALGLTTDVVGLKNQTLQGIMNKSGVTTNKVAADLKKPDGLYYALTDVKTAFEKSGLSASQADQVMAKIFGGGRSDKAIMSLMSNLDGVKQKYDAIGKGVSNYASSWKKTQNTVSFQWKTAVADVQNLAISFGSILLPAVNSVLKVLDHFMSFLQKNPALAAFAGAMIAVAIGFKVAAAAESLFNAVTDANPVMLILIAIIALAAGLYYLYTHFKIVRDVVHDVAHGFDVFRHFVAAAAHDVAHVFDVARHAVAAAAHDIAHVFDQIRSAIARAIDAVVGFVKSHWKLLIAIILGPLGLIIDALATHWSAVKHGFEATWNFVSGIVKTVTGFISGIIKDFLAGVKKVFSIGWDAVKPIVMAVWNFIKGIVLDGVRGVETVLSWFGKLGSLFYGWFMNGVHAVVNAVGSLLRFVGGIPGWINNALGGLPGMMLNAGINAINSLINGIWSGVGALGSMMGKIASKVAGFFGLSPAKEGPLSGGGAPQIRGRHLAADIAAGMLDEERSIAAAAHTLAGSAGLLPGGAGNLVPGGGTAGAGASGGMSIGPITLTVNGFVGNQQELVQQLYLMLQQGALQNNRRNPTNGLALLVR